MSVTFTRESDTVYLSDPAGGGLERRVKRQALGRTAGGNVFSYDKGVETIEATLAFATLCRAEKDALYAFFRDATLGTRETFDYTDSDGVVHTARFLSPQLRFAGVGANAWSCRLILELNLTEG